MAHVKHTRFETLADALEELSLHEQLNDNGRLAREYRTAAGAIREVDAIPPDPSDIPDVSRRVRDDIAEWRAFGEIDKLTTYQEKRPYLSTLCQIAKVGPVTAKRLHEEKNVETLDDVRELADGDEIEDVTGIGPKTATTIRRSVAQL